MKLRTTEFDKPTEKTLKVIYEFILDNMSIEFIPNEGAKCLIVNDDKGQLMGVAYYYENFLKYICVNKQYRRMGIGKRLVDKLLEQYESLLLEIRSEVILVGSELTIGSMGWNFYNKYYDVEAIEFGKYRLRQRPF